MVWPLKMDECLTRLDYSNIPSYQNKFRESLWEYFCDHDDDLMDHVFKLLVVSQYVTIKNKDVYIISFVLHLEGKANSWFEGLEKGKMSSLLELTEMFCSHWYPEEHK